MKPNKLVAEKIKILEGKLLLPQVRQDPAELMNLISDEFVEIGCSGDIYDKKLAIETLQLEIPAVMYMENFNSVKLGNDSIYITYKAVRIEENKKINSIRNSIWKCEDGEWRIVFHQGTQVNSEGKI